MITYIVSALLISGALTISYVTWQKERSRHDLHYVRLYGAGLLAIAWQYIANELLHLSGTAQRINHYGLFLFWLIEAGLWIALVVKPRSPDL